MNEKIKELRKALGLTLEKFGAKLGVKRNTVSQWENGKNITNQTIAFICNVNWNGKYVNEDWIRGNSDEMFKPDSVGELEALAKKYNMSSMEYAFLKEYFKLEPSRREHFFETLDMMFTAIHAGDSPAPGAEPTIDEQVESFRQELELEEKAKEKSSALQKNA